MITCAQCKHYLQIVSFGNGNNFREREKCMILNDVLNYADYGEVKTPAGTFYAPLIFSCSHFEEKDANAGYKHKEDDQ